MKILFLFCALLTASPTWAAGTDWTTADTARQSVYAVLQSADWYQTRRIAAHPSKFHEVNPLLGSHPSKTKVDIFMGASLAAHTAISYYLQPKYRAAWQYATITVKSGMVAYNFAVLF